MRKIAFVTIALFALAVLFPAALGASSIDPAADQTARRALALSNAAYKIDPTVLQTLQNGGTTRTLIVMSEQADVSTARNLPTKTEKGRYVYNTLRATADRTQASVRSILDHLGKNYTSYYIANVIAVENLDANAAAQIAARPEVGSIDANPNVLFSGPAAKNPSPEAAQGIEWNISKINAPQMWQLGFKGQGIVVANQDTGVQWKHPALINQYRGYNKQTKKVVHNYNWWDAIHKDIDHSSNPCGYNSQAPCDDNDHGTHTMGTMVGSDGANQIGVAPQAKWIACRDMDSGVGRPSTYMECFEFFLAPWNKKGNNPNPDLAPDVVSNSWGCTNSEGCKTNNINVLKTTVENVRAAGIFVAVSAGNDGSSCSTINEPAALYDAATTIGATDSSDRLAGFSSRGPVTRDGSNRLKPDISAPGVNVRSSIPNNSYASFSGTSMASPHVAGAVALLWNAVPSLRGNVDSTEEILENSANPNVTILGNANQTCGGTNHTVIPNNLFGYGRLDVAHAYQNSVP